MAIKHIIYLHGFNSSSASEKAQLTRQHFAAQKHFALSVPQLPPEPELAMACIQQEIETLGVSNLAGFIGSSLGGYYSLYLHARYQLPAVLVNPAIRPYELLLDFLGENTNPYTGEHYVVKAEHMAQLQALEARSGCDPDKLYLLTQTGDEVLDYRQALDALPGAMTWVSGGGDHAFQNFVQVLPSILAFFSRFES